MAKLTLADIFSGFWHFFPRMEREIGRLVDSLSRNLSIVFVVEGEDAREEKVGDDSQTPEIDLFSIRLLQKNLGCHIRLFNS